MKEIIIDIEPDATVKVDARGFSGAECTKATAAIEAALGEVERRREKPEYRQRRVVTRKAGA